MILDRSSSVLSVEPPKTFLLRTGVFSTHIVNMHSSLLLSAMAQGALAQINAFNQLDGSRTSTIIDETARGMPTSPKLTGWVSRTDKAIAKYLFPVRPSLPPAQQHDLEPNAAESPPEDPATSSPT